MKNLLYLLILSLRSNTPIVAGVVVLSTNTTSIVSASATVPDSTSPKSLRTILLTSYYQEVSAKLYVNVYVPDVEILVSNTSLSTVAETIPPVEVTLATALEGVVLPATGTVFTT